MDSSRWILFSTVLIFLLIGLSGCPKPGEGKKAERGFLLCEPIIAALAGYYTDLGEYPDSLAALIPQYVNDVPEFFDNMPIVYEKTSQSYNLQFSYEGPGINDCIYTPETDWQCKGHF